MALVKIVEGELTVLDHEGDNFLGGTDFDALIVEKLVVQFPRDSERHPALVTKNQHAAKNLIN